MSQTPASSSREREERTSSRRGGNIRPQGPASAQDVDDIDQIVATLRRLQRRAPNRTRFHLLMETETERMPPSSNSTLQASSGGRNMNMSYTVDVDTRVLYSPTISFQTSNQTTRQKRQLGKLVRAINELSFLATHPTQQSDEINDEINIPNRRRIPRLFNSSDEEEGTDQDILNVEPFEVPDWFPFEHEEYSTGPQASKHESLQISSDVATKFESLPNDDICNLYRFFFQYMHNQAKKKKSAYKRGKMKYSLFTPPWLRQRLIVCGNVTVMSKVAIQDQRDQRNKQGYKRMALILGAFYENEVRFGQYVLDYLLQILPKLKEIWSTKQNTPFKTIMKTINRRSRRSDSPPSRRVRRRLETTESEDVLVAHDGGTELEPVLISHQQKKEAGNDVDITKSKGNTYADHQNRSNADEENAAQSRQSQGHSMESLVSAQGVQRDNAPIANIGRNAMNPAPTAPNVDSTHRIGRQGNAGTTSEQGNGGAPTIALSCGSGSSGAKPPSGRKTLNKRIYDRPIPVDSSDENQVMGEEQERQEKEARTQRAIAAKRRHASYCLSVRKREELARMADERNRKKQEKYKREETKQADERLKVQARATLSNVVAPPIANRTAEEKVGIAEKGTMQGSSSSLQPKRTRNKTELVLRSLHGNRVVLNLGDHDEIHNAEKKNVKRNDDQAPQNPHRNHAKQADRISDVRLTTALVLCAAQSQCILKDNPSAQDPAGITGRCRGCKKRLHDLCGGGEDGNMLCPSCRK